MSCGVDPTRDGSAEGRSTVASERSGGWADGTASKLRSPLMQDSKSSSERASAGVVLDPAQLSPGALRGLVEEYVTREGTDYGQGEWSLEEKVAQVFRQLEAGEAQIVFDLELESASIVTAPELALHTLDPALEDPVREQGPKSRRSSTR